MNKALLIGRIASDLNLKYTNNNNSVCEFSLAINRIGSEGTDFLNCTVWNKQAENLVKYQSKGSLISVEGSNRVDRYQNEQGENRYKHYILVNSIQFLESKKEEISNNNQMIETNEIKVKQEEDPFKMFAESNDDDMPW